MKKKLVFGELVMAVLSGGKDAHARCRVPEIPEGVYSTITIVTDVDYDTDVVTIKTFSGIEYQFEGCKDWHEGDICTVTIWDNDTYTMMKSCKQDIAAGLMTHGIYSKEVKIWD